MNQINRNRLWGKFCSGWKFRNTLLLLLFVSVTAVAQDNNSEVTVIKATQFNVTRPLSEIFAENPVPDNFSIPKAEIPDKKKRTPQSFPLAKEGDPVYGNDESTIQREAGSVESMNVKASWQGGTGSGRPFDPSGAVGLNHYIQMINATVFRVYNKSTGAVLLTGNLGNLWSPAVPNAGDPIVMYDKAADRWFLAQFGSGNQIYIAVSQTSNPLGSWFTYTFVSPQFPDYLKFGVWHDAYYMTSNQGTQKVYAFNRNEILAGTPGARSIFVNYSPPNGSGFFCPLPADAGDGNLPPAGTPCPILSYSDNGWGAGYTDAVNIYNMAINWVPVTPTATITLAANVATAAFNANYNPSWLDCPQPGTAQKLDGIGGVLMYRAQWKSWPGYNSLVLNWGVEISSTQRGIKWCELRQTSGVWSMYQEGIFSPGSDTRWMGSISMNDQGSIGLCYMRSNSTTMYPSIYYTGRRTCDPLGTLPVTETLVAAGTVSQSGFANPNASKRVGDYAHMSIDPSNGTTFWGTSEFFGGTSGTDAARTQVFSFDISPCVVLTAGVTITISGGSNPTCGNALVTFTASPTNGGTAPVYQWKVNGVNVGTNSVNYSSSSLVAGDVVTCVMTSNLAGVVGNPATSNAINMQVSAAPTLGTATITSPICFGSNAVITYTPPPCEVDMGFQNTYAPGNWSLTQTNSNGSVNTSSAPGSITLTSSNGFTGAGTTAYAITIPCSGNVTFNWSYSTVDGAPYDYPTYSINGGAPLFLSGYSISNGIAQSGTQTIAVNAGDVLSLNAYSTDNQFGSCTIVISNFFGPATTNQHFDIFDAATGGNLLNWSYSGTLDVTPAAPGTFTYYVAAHSNLTGCYSDSRLPVTVVVYPTPDLGTAVISPTTVCLGEPTTITYTPPACQSNIGFQNAYDPSNWTLTQSNSNGSVNTTQVPGSLTFVSSNGLFGPGSTNYSITVSCTGNISFNWNYSTVDGSFWDYPRYSINGGAPQLFSGYSTSGGTTQSGTVSIPVNAGDVFNLEMYSVDNGSGSATAVISNFIAPTSTNQHFDVFDAPNAGNLLTWSYTGSVAVTPSTIGTTTYFIFAHDNGTGCYSSIGVPVSVFVNPLPILGTTTGSVSGNGCLGESINCTYNPVVCGTSTDFQDYYAPANWNLALTNSNGSVITTSAPSSITMVSSNGIGSTSGNTAYSITIPCTGNISFNWDYTTVDGAFYDYPAYQINGGTLTALPGFNFGLGSLPQNGTFTLAVNAGDVFTIDAYSVDNFAGSCNIVLSSFVAPVSLPSQFYSWYDAPSGGNLIGFGTALTQTPTTPGTYTYYVQVNDVNCSNPIRVATSAFTILPKPTVTASADVTICENNSTSLSASGSATGFIWNPGALIGNPVNVTPSSTIIYTVTGTDANGCTNTDDVIVYVTPVPTLGTASANPPFICLGNSTSLSYTPPAGLSCNGAYQTFFGGAYAPANWTTTQTNSNGSVNTTSAPTSISLISSNNGSGVTGTLSYSIPISCSGVVSFQWSYSTVDGSFYDYPMYSVNGGSSNLFPGYILLPNTTIQNGFFQLLVNAGDVLSLNCYSLDNVAGSCTVDITNFSAPTQTASVQSVTWFNAPSGGTNLGSTNPLTVVPTTAGSFTYYAAVTNALGCSNPLRVATNTVTVSSLPVANAGVDKTLTCTTPSATLGTAAVGGNTYSWNPATGLSSASSATPTCSATVTTTYTLTVTNASGCVATDVVTVTVNKTAPTANAGSAVTLTCTSPSATLGTAAIGGNTYLWSPATALSASNVAQPTCSATATTTYTVTVTGSNGCTATSSVLVTVNKSAPTANAGSAITLTCTTPSATIGTVAVGGNTYLWSPATALSASNVAQPTCSATATTTYTVTVTGSNGCTATSSVVVTVNKSAPTANAGSAVTLTCTTPSATIGSVAVGGNSYLWSPATTLSASNVAQPTCSATATTIYTVTVTGSNGCTATSTIHVTVNKTAPTVSTSATSTSIACGASTTISATGASTYAWQPGSLSGSSIIVSPTITTTYTVTGTATNGCTATATRLITVAPCGSTVNVKLFIEGYYISSSTMQPALLNQGAPGASASQSDTITVELHNTTPPYAAVASQKRILNTNGTSTGNFGVSGNYYIVVKHRNSLELWSAAPVAVSGTVSYDFSNLASKAYGSNQVQMQPGVFATYSGDINQDLSIDVFDYIEMDPEILSGAFGYYAEDVNGDGSVDVFDYLVVDPNITNGVGAATP